MLKLAEIQTQDEPAIDTEHDQMVMSYNNLIASLFSLKDDLLTYHQMLEDDNITVSRKKFLFYQKIIDTVVLW